mmetsp:Transcript_31289/g.100076  ORF Transcript_31289/g.100076 Transcript_31289/m.100076 type:complete len:212 (+) Transcript_31289:74-709(+)
MTSSSEALAGCWAAPSWVKVPGRATKRQLLSPRLVFHLAREDRGNEGEDEQRDLRLACLDEQLDRGVAGHEGSEIRAHHADRRRREHVEGELPLLGSHEVRELGRNLAEGEHSIDIPARARNTASLVRGATAVDAERAKDARTERGVRHGGRRVEESSCEPKTHAGRLPNRRLRLGDHFEVLHCLELRCGGSRASRHAAARNRRLRLEQRR